MSKIDDVLGELDMASTRQTHNLLLKALKHPDVVGHLRMAAILTEAGAEVSETSVRRWRIAHGVD